MEKYGVNEISGEYILPINYSRLRKLDKVDIYHLNNTQFKNPISFDQIEEDKFFKFIIDQSIRLYLLENNIKVDNYNSNSVDYCYNYYLMSEKFFKNIAPTVYMKIDLTDADSKYMEFFFNKIEEFGFRFVAKQLTSYFSSRNKTSILYYFTNDENISILIYYGLIWGGNCYKHFINCNSHYIIPFRVNNNLSHYRYDNKDIFLYNVYYNIRMMLNKKHFDDFLNIYPFMNSMHKYLYILDETINDRKINLEQYNIYRKLPTYYEHTFITIKKVFERQYGIKYFRPDPSIYKQIFQKKSNNIV